MILYALTFAGPGGRCSKHNPGMREFQLLPKGQANVSALKKCLIAIILTV